MGILTGFEYKIGISLSDEGFLWYGTQRVAKGEVPLRDFQSYEPGRYYWGAAWSKLLGTGLVALRVSTAIFAAIGMACGLMIARRLRLNTFEMVFLAALQAVWLYPRYKAFDSAIVLVSVLVATRLIENPCVSTHFQAGLFTGMAGFFGRNHALYAIATYFLLILIMKVRGEQWERLKWLRAWIAGVAVGCAPLITMIVVFPGFFEGLVDTCLLWTRLGATNLPLPVPWPWRLDYAGWHWIQSTSKLVLGTLFLVILLFYAAGVLLLATKRRRASNPNAVLSASLLVGSVYLHYVFSRADLAHLAVSVPPTLLGLASLTHPSYSKRSKTLMSALALFWVLATALTVGRASPVYYKWTSKPGQIREHDIAGDRIWLDVEEGRMLDSIATSIRSNVGEHEGVLIAPRWPMMYCILGRCSPVWEIYFLLPQPVNEQLQTVARIKGGAARVALIGDLPLDGRDDLRFSHTHHLVWEYLMSEFVEIPVPNMPQHYHMLLRRDH